MRSCGSQRGMTRCLACRLHSSVLLLVTGWYQLRGALQRRALAAVVASAPSRLTPLSPTHQHPLSNPPSLHAVDIWSGNHPFFQGNASTVVTDEGRVNRFKRRFAGLDSLAAVETISGQQAAKKAAAAAKQ